MGVMVAILKISLKNPPPEVFDAKDNVSEVKQSSYVPSIEAYDNVDIVEDKKVVTPPSVPIDNIYNDSNDPSAEDIKKNTENIVLNDITLPVIDESKSENNGVSLGNTSPTIVNKVEQTISSGSTNNEMGETNNKDVKMFSFDSLYPSMKTFGSITKDSNTTNTNTLGAISENETTKKDENIDKTVENISQNNDKVLKEVMKIDKQGENIDDTETLDNFFNDVKKIASVGDKSINVDTKETSYTFFD